MFFRVLKRFSLGLGGGSLPPCPLKKPSKQSGQQSVQKDGYGFVALRGVVCWPCSVFSLLGDADLVPPSLRSVSSGGCWDSSSRHSGLSCGGHFLIHEPRLPRNSERVLRIVFTAALSEPEAQAEHSRYLAQAKADLAISASEALWEKRWRASFSRADKTYSGSLPVLSTSDAEIRRLYYGCASI